MRSLVWFRADLRTHDNAALSRATRVSPDGTIGVFLIADEQWAEHDWAGVRVAFMLRTLLALSASLAKLNIPLLIRRARFLMRGCADRRHAEHGCGALWFNREYEVNERRRDERVEEAVSAIGAVVQAFDDQTVLEPGCVRTNDGGPYTVYSPFKRKWYEVFERRCEEPGLRSGLRRRNRRRGSVLRRTLCRKRWMVYDVG